MNGTNDALGQADFEISAEQRAVLCGGANLAEDELCNASAIVFRACAMRLEHRTEHRARDDEKHRKNEEVPHRACESSIESTSQKGSRSICCAKSLGEKFIRQHSASERESS